MRVLLLGGGGREHAIGWKLAQSALTGVDLGPRQPRPCRARAPWSPASTSPTPKPSSASPWPTPVDLVVVGPEAPLAAGVVDALVDAGHRRLRPDMPPGPGSNRRRPSPKT